MKANWNNVKAVVIVWDQGRTTLQDKAAFEKCVDFVFERVTTHLNKCGDFGLFIADKPGGGKKQDDEFLSNFVQRIEDGTDYCLPDRIVLNVLTTPSHLLRHLQLADLITGITTAMVGGKYRFAKPLFESVKRLMLSNYQGWIGGTGLKVFPNTLTNLYYWVLGEDHYVKIGNQSAVPLPEKSWLYSQNEL